MADVAVAWSTGKDAALALQAVAADPDLRVAELFTTVEAASGRVRGHGLDGRLLARQSQCRCRVQPTSAGPGSETPRSERMVAEGA